MKTLMWGAAAAAMVLCSSGTAGAELWNPAPDLIITGATVVTMGKTPTAQALAIKGNRIVGVGSNAEVLALRGKDTKVVNGAGKTVLPGLQDSHIHPMSLGRDVALSTDLIRAKSPADISQALTELKARIKAKPGQWLSGARWDASQITPLFTRWDIDPVTPENPAYLGRYRGLAINTAALNLMGIKDDDPKTWPAWWLKDPENFTAEDTIYRAKRRITVSGETKEYEVPTGVFVGTMALRLITVRPPPPTLDDDVESVRLGSIELQKVGITSVVDAGNNMGHTTRVFSLAQNRGVLGVRIPASFEGVFFNQTPQQIRTILDGQKESNFGNEWVRLRGAKIYGDGGPSARGSWVSKPYLPQPGQTADDFGVPVEPDYDKREAQYRTILSYGFDLHTHSTGDAAMLESVRLYRKLLDEILAKDPKADLRWSIEHANMPLETPEVIDTMAKYRIYASIQPVMISELGNAWTLNLGSERMGRNLPAKSYMAKGVMVVSGSDYSVTPYDPWLGMYALVTRKDINNGKVYGPDERISIEDALKTYTINGAYVTYEEKTKGSLEVGKLADFVVVDIPDLIAAVKKDPEVLRTMAAKVQATAIDGVVRYQRPGSALFN